MSEVRLIDANALISKMVNEPVKAVDGVDFDTEWFTRIADTAVQFTDMVENAPTVDAVPVVRCRDCRFHIKEDDFEYWCNGFCQHARLVNPDDYCSRGMLKECTVETCGYCENGLCYRAEDAPKSRNCPFTKGEANGKG